MIRLQPISTSDLQHYKFMEELLVDSFPPEEYRQLEQLREFTDRTGNFHNNIIFDDDLPIGFITYWDFGNFYYVEHFATNPALRNGGYGKRTLEYLCDYLTPHCTRSGASGRRNGKETYRLLPTSRFVLWKKDYRQPPYKPGDHFLPMYLMVHGNLDPEKDYEDIKHKLHTVVYGAKE